MRVFWAREVLRLLVLKRTYYIHYSGTGYGGCAYKTFGTTAGAHVAIL